MKGYYLDTENLPLYNWRLLNVKNDLSFLRLNKSVGSDLDDSKVWDIVLDTYYNEFGLSDDYEVLLELKMDLALKQNDFAISGDNFLLNKIRHLTDDIKDIIEKEVDGDLNSAINAVSKWCGYRINQKEVMTNEFFYLLRDFKIEIDTLKQQKNGKG